MSSIAIRGICVIGGSYRSDSSIVDRSSDGSWRSRSYSLGCSKQQPEDVADQVPHGHVARDEQQQRVADDLLIVISPSAAAAAISPRKSSPPVSRPPISQELMGVGAQLRCSRGRCDASSSSLVIGMMLKKSTKSTDHSTTRWRSSGGMPMKSDRT